MAQYNLSLFKRSNDFWYVTYRINGRVRWRSTHTRSKQIALQFLRDFTDQPEPPPRPHTILSEFRCEFLKYAAATYSKKTCELYVSVTGRFLKCCGDIPLDHITLRAWDEYFVRRGSQLCATSINIEQRTLKSFMNRAVLWELIPTSPFARCKPVRVPESPPRFFEREELHHLLSLVKEEWLKDAIRFTVSTGLRRGELSFVGM